MLDPAVVNANVNAVGERLGAHDAAQAAALAQMQIELMAALHELLSRGGTALAAFGLPRFGGGQYQTFSSSGNFTVPAGVTGIRVQVVGGGGNGGLGYTLNGTRISGGGGGGGGYAHKTVTVTPGQTIPVVVGAAGGTTSFGGALSATGGSTGGNATNAGSTPVRGTAGAGGNGIGGDLNVRGGDGLGGIGGARGTSLGASPAGGATQDGSGAGGLDGAAYGAEGGAGRGYGCGGGGGTGFVMSGSGSGFSGGVGTSGLCIVEW